MQVHPWCDRSLWTRALARPLEAGAPAARRALLSLLQPSKGGIMWRTSKNSVAHELGIPRQVANVQRLALSAVERHAYRRCHRETADRARDMLPAAVVAAARAGRAVAAEDDRPLTTKEGDTLFPLLVKLRQVRCCVCMQCSWYCAVLQPAAGLSMLLHRVAMTY